MSDRGRRRVLACAVGVIASALATGCAATHGQNPSFPLDVSTARAELRDMAAHPLPLRRPVVVAGGYMDPGIAAHRVARRLRSVTTEPGRVIEAAFFSNATMETARRRLVEKVEEAFPSGDPEWTTEVDVVGISMGGLVARYAAMDNGGAHKRLRIATLYTISTPHRGADAATLPTFDRKQIAMRKGSAFYESLAAPEFPIIPYVRLGDEMVGAPNTSPEGEGVWWVPNIPGELAHMQAQHDPRFGADIARRLRGERAYTTRPPAALPE